MSFPTLKEYSRREAEIQHALQRAAKLPVNCDACGEQLTDTHPKLSLGDRIRVHCTGCGWKGSAPYSVRRSAATHRLRARTNFTGD